MKWLLRLLGFCGHEIEWSAPKYAHVDGVGERRIQDGRCKRCGIERTRYSSVSRF